MTFGVYSYDEIRPLLGIASRRLGISARAGRSVIDRARRFPVEATPGVERFGRAEEHDLARIDRVDALVDLWEQFRAPRARRLVGSAEGLLEEARAVLRGPARHAVDTALMRVSAGFPFSAVS